jgi:hypothetical protein
LFEEAAYFHFSIRTLLCLPIRSCERLEDCPTLLLTPQKGKSLKKVITPASTHGSPRCRSLGDGLTSSRRKACRPNQFQAGFWVRLAGPRHSGRGCCAFESLLSFKVGSYPPVKAGRPSALRSQATAGRWLHGQLSVAGRVVHPAQSRFARTRLGSTVRAHILLPVHPSVWLIMQGSSNFPARAHATTCHGACLPCPLSVRLPFA